MEKIIISLLFVFLVLFPFGQLTKIPFNFLDFSEAHLYLTDIVLFFLVLSWGSWRIFDKKKKYQLPPLAKPIFLFVFLSGISLIINSPLFAGREVMVGSFYLIRWVFYAGFYFVLFDLGKKLPWLKKNWPCFLLIIGSMFGLFGFLQYFWFPNLKALEVLQYDPHFYRLIGTFLDPGFTGIVLVLTLFLIIFVWFEEKKKYLIPLGLFVFSALALTYSRASWLVFLIGLFLISFRKKAWLFLAAAVILFVLTFYFLPRPVGEGGKIERTYTIYSRLENYRQALTIIKKHPFFGVGFNTYRYAQRNEGFLTEEEWQVSHAGGGADSSFLLVLATTGIFGFLAYLWLWVKIFKEKKTNFLVLVSLLAILIHACFLNSLFYPSVMFCIWFLLALSPRN